MEKTSSLIDEPKEIENICRTLSKEKQIGFDTEFVRESTFYPIVEIIQLASRYETFLIDARIGKEKLQPVLDLFTSKNILKIGHALQGDQECLFTEFDLFASPCLDTSIAAALCGYGENRGLSHVLQDVIGVEIKKGHARSHWGVRPLPAPLLEYASADVKHLVSLGDKIISHLEKLDRKDWALELTAKYEDSSLYEPDPREMAEKLAKSKRLDQASFSALIELMNWRETRVRELNIPRRWLADDSVLMDLAQTRPKDLNHLKSFRGIHKGEVVKSAQSILDAIARASQMRGVKLPPVGRYKSPSLQESQLMEFLHCYVHILSIETRVAPKYLMTTSQLLPLIRYNAKSSQDWIQEGLLDSFVVKTVGEKIFSFLNGKTALCVKNCAIEIIDLDR